MPVSAPRAGLSALLLPARSPPPRSSSPACSSDATTPDPGGRGAGAARHARSCVRGARTAYRGDVGAHVTRRFPSLRRLAGSSATCGPGSGDELAFALPAAAVTRSSIAKVADRAGAERYRAQLQRPRSAFAGDFLVVRAAEAFAGARGRSLADNPVYERAAAELDRRRSSSTPPPRACGALLAQAPSALQAVGAFVETPHFEGLAARVRPEERRRARQRARAARRRRPARRGSSRPRSRAGRRPPQPPSSTPPGADALADAARARRRRSRCWPPSAPRCPSSPGSTSTATCSARWAPRPPSRSPPAAPRRSSPLTARSDNPPLTREALARLQEPLAEQLTPATRAVSRRSTTTPTRCPSPARSSPRTPSTATS